MYTLYKHIHMYIYTHVYFVFLIDTKKLVTLCSQVIIRPDRNASAELLQATVVQLA